MDVNSGNNKKSRIILWIVGIVLVPVVVFILIYMDNADLGFLQG